MDEYVNLGFDRPAPTAASTPAPDVNGPASDRQKAFLNDLGVLPDEVPATYGEASNLIRLKQPAFAAFKDANDGQKPATGRQRAALLRRNMTAADVNALTKTAAAEALQEDSSTTEPTGPQLELLRKLGNNTTPASSADASDLIKTLIAAKNKPTEKQLALLKKLKPGITDAILARLTGAQASAMIAALLARYNATGGKRKRSSRKDTQDPADDDDESGSAATQAEGAPVRRGVYG